MAKIKRMNINDFINLGYLQEVNRQFFHPLGLALEVTVNTKGKARLTGLWDCRDDPEGVRFGKCLSNNNAERKAKYIRAESRRFAKLRRKLLGYKVQPIGNRKNQRKINQSD